MFRNLVSVKFLSICMSRARNIVPLKGNAVLFFYTKNRVVSFVLTKTIEHTRVFVIPTMVS
jgi:hypothetical protein